MPSRQILRGAPAKTKPTPRGGLWSRSLLMRLKRECTEERAAAARFAPVHAEVIAAIGAFRGHRRHRVVQVGRERRIKDLFVMAELVAAPIARVEIRARLAASSVAKPWRFGSTAKPMGDTSIATTARNNAP